MYIHLVKLASEASPDQYSKTANICGIKNNKLGTDTNRIVLFIRVNFLVYGLASILTTEKVDNVRTAA